MLARDEGERTKGRVNEDTDRFGYNTDLNTPPSTEHALRAVKGEKKSRVVRS